eukprot:7047354-Prorocentrum_lima.AAC.1
MEVKPSQHSDSTPTDRPRPCPTKSTEAFPLQGANARERVCLLGQPLCPAMCDVTYCHLPIAAKRWRS